MFYKTRTRILCLHYFNLAVGLERQRQPELAARPLVVVRIWDAQVLDACPLAAAAGVQPGAARRRVEQLCPEAALLPAAEDDYQQLHAALRTTLLHFAGAGRVEAAALGEFYVDVAGLTSAFGSETDLAEQLRAALAPVTALAPAIGIAENKFTAARAAAAHHAAGCASGALLVAGGSAAEFLAPQPLQALPNLPAEMLRRLQLFGLHTLGNFAALPAAAVATQFDAAGLCYHALARGRDARPLLPHTPPLILRCSHALPEGLPDRQALHNHAGRLAQRLAAALQAASVHTTALAVELQQDTGPAQQAGAAVKPPCADARRLQRMAQRLLEQFELTTAAGTLRLTAYPLRAWHLGASQPELLPERTARPSDNMHQTVRALRQRFGAPVMQLASTLGPPQPLPLQVRSAPDGSPQLVRLPKNNGTRTVQQVLEFWREQRSWWEQPVQREYYLVEAVGGRLLTLFHDARAGWFLDRRCEL
ncbi:hypothetical protein LBMAG37_14180 [Anaerolineae bacterium]|nr:DNA polymerase IV [Anaerolineaceae bacterium]GDX68263.1 hypothetical protein LBMAG37_14180 [Anaerolineae bacterium]